MSNTQGLDRILAKITRLEQIPERMVQVVDDSLLALEAAAKVNASGPRPEHIDEVTGDLVRQIQSTGAKVNGSEISGEVVSMSDHGRIHENGGVIKAKNAPKLVWQDSSGNWFSKDEVVIPARPYFGPAVKEVRGQFLKDAQDVVQEAMR